MGPSSGKRGALQAAINVTPLVDVVLVLLIIFMVVTPMLAQSKELELPNALIDSPEASSEGSVVLELSKTGKLLLQGREVPISQVVSRLRAASPAGTPHVLLKADGTSVVKPVREVLRVLKAGGIQHVAFAVREPRKGTP